MCRSYWLLKLAGLQRARSPPVADAIGGFFSLSETDEVVCLEIKYLLFAFEVNPQHDYEAISLYLYVRVRF
jgi:hypothetical protein